MSGISEDKVLPNPSVDTHKSRKIVADRQNDLIQEMLKEYDMDTNQEVLLGAYSSVKDWTANKGWKLRHYFIEIGTHVVIMFAKFRREV